MKKYIIILVILFVLGGWLMSTVNDVLRNFSISIGANHLSISDQDFCRNVKICNGVENASGSCYGSDTIGVYVPNSFLKENGLDSGKHFSLYIGKVTMRDGGVGQMANYCVRGSGTGQNVNWFYCNYFPDATFKKRIISKAGVIQPDEIYTISKAVFDGKGNLVECGITH